MEISALNRSVSAANLPLEKLAGSNQVTEPEKLAEVSRQFEAVLLRQILGQAQKPLFQSALMAGGGSGGAIYQDMITQQLADRISQGGSFGFAKVLEKELSGRYLKKGGAVETASSSTKNVELRGSTERLDKAHPSSNDAKPQMRPQPGKRI